LHKRDKTIDARVAAMAEPLAVALHAVRKANIPAGEPVLVVGCGTIGGLCAVLLSRLHEGPILLAERNGERARLVAEATGGRVVDLSGTSIGAALGGARLRYAIDATGSVAALAQTIGLMAGGGALALVGISHGNLDLDPNVLVEMELALIGCHAFKDELPEAIALLGSLEAVLLGLLDETIGLEDVPAAFERLIAGKSQGLKTVIRIAD
jgi:(R,R)-butanediol dehydrogenase/meso-butanediol dehydrogenase/diacetyl reductase